MVDGWSGIPGSVVFVPIKNVDVTFSEVPSVGRGAGSRNDEVVEGETDIGLGGITGLAVERMMANPAMPRARRGLKGNCIFFFKRRSLGVFWCVDK